MGLRVLYWQRRITRSPLLAGLVVCLVLVMQLMMPCGLRASARPAGMPSGSPLQEQERPAEEERSGPSSDPLNPTSWRSRRSSASGGGRLAAFLHPRSLAIACQPTLGGDRPSRALDEPASLLALPQAFHHWVRSQTW